MAALESAREKEETVHTHWSAASFLLGALGVPDCKELFTGMVFFTYHCVRYFTVQYNGFKEKQREFGSGLFLVNDFSTGSYFNSLFLFFIIEFAMETVSLLMENCILHCIHLQCRLFTTKWKALEWKCLHVIFRVFYCRTCLFKVLFFHLQVYFICYAW